MDVATLSRFFALLALACGALAIGVVVLALGGVANPRLADVRDRSFTALADSALPLAWLIATVATVGSLYYSEVVHFVPCRLCWYQRIAMYPMAIVLGVAALRRDRSVWRYALPVVAIGGVIALYHYALEWNPSLDAGVCSTDVPCSAVLFRTFGFISLPYMALSAFACITALLLIARRHEGADASTPEEDT